MRILLLVHAFNSLSQRIFAELEAAGHEVTVEFDVHDDVTQEAVHLFAPDVIVAPFLKRAIPESIWRSLPCLIVHPGIPGDGGPSALDWAILNAESQWGVTVLQAEAEMDAGPVWAHAPFEMRAAAKSSLYRREVTEAAVKAVHQAVERLSQGGFKPQKADALNVARLGAWQATAKQADREIDWRSDDTATVLRKIRSADGVPGVKDAIDDETVFLYDAHAAEGLAGKPGDIIARSGPAIARATADGAVWIGHLRAPSGAHPFKLPASNVLEGRIEGLPEVPVNAKGGYQDISYTERGDTGYLSFDFYNGAMGTEACQRLLTAYLDACKRPTKVIVLMGGPEFWSNGMNLNLIEAADNPADESWSNINAIDDLAEAILSTQSHLTVAAMQGNAGAGGVFLARAADYVWLRSGLILNPHYKDMGNLYGSEFWTYLLPQFAGRDGAAELMQNRLPMSAAEAVAKGVANAHFGSDHTSFEVEVYRRAAELCALDGFEAQLHEKTARREADEAVKPLSQYRAEELAEMRRNFSGPDPSYHVARYNFVCKVPKSRTPRSLARHRSQRPADTQRKAS